MSGAQSISARRAYGVHRVCRVWGRARSSVYVRRHATRSRASRRRGPVGAATDEVLVGHIRRVLEASPFHGEGYRKAWAKLRGERIRTSQERVRRLMREHGLQAPCRTGHAHGPKAHDGTITTAAPDVMWGTDMTSTVTVGEGAACVFVAVDHCTTECIGLHAAKRGTRFEALEPIRQGVREPSVTRAATRAEFRETFASWLMLQAYRLQQGNAALSYQQMKQALARTMPTSARPGPTRASRRQRARAGRHAPDRAQEPRHLRPLQHHPRAGTARRL